MYDVIIVGARVAGSSTAMLLAGKGLRVLLVDRATFPSDTLSTHQVQLPGGARLRRWGLLDQVVASGAPAARKVRFDAGPVVLQGRYPPSRGSTPSTARAGRSLTPCCWRRRGPPGPRCASASSSRS